MPFLDMKNCSINSTSNQRLPSEGPVSIPVPGLDFSVTTFPEGYTMDLSNIMAQGKFTMLQSVFVDNTLNGSVLFIEVQGSTGQVLQIPAGKQAYLPILCGSQARLFFSSQGNVTPTVRLLNFPVAPCVW